MPLSFRLIALAIGLLPATTRSQEEIRVLSFNLRYANSADKGPKAWASRRETTASLIRRDSPDLIGTQEALRSMLDDLAQRLPEYAEIGVGRDDGRTKGEYSAILFHKDRWHILSSGTFWLSDTPDQPGSATWGNRVTRICTWARMQSRRSKQEIAIFNTHFDHQSQPARERSAALVRDRIAALPRDLPVLLTGDLNAIPDNPALRTLLQGPPTLKDTWTAATRAAPSGTFHDFTTSPAGPRIDYILCSHHWLPTAHAILRDTGPDGQPPSDHFPIRATLRIQPPAGNHPSGKTSGKNLE